MQKSSYLCRVDADVVTLSRTHASSLSALLRMPFPCLLTRLSAKGADAVQLGPHHPPPAAWARQHLPLRDNPSLCGVGRDALIPPRKLWDRRVGIWGCLPTTVSRERCGIVIEKRLSSPPKNGGRTVPASVRYNFVSTSASGGRKRAAARN